jgi:hypothetical protein
MPTKALNLAYENSGCGSCLDVRRGLSQKVFGVVVQARGSAGESSETAPASAFLRLIVCGLSCSSSDSSDVLMADSQDLSSFKAPDLVQSTGSPSNPVARP